jgi:hypothetical protein
MWRGGRLWWWNTKRRAGLHEMNVKEVINSVSKPHHEDQEGVFRYHAERVVAAVLTQTFSYMLQAGTFRGYMTTGEVIVFLRISSEDASTLEYHLAEPGEDVRAQQSASAAGGFLHRTAVSRVLAFCLGALQSPIIPQEWQRDAMERLAEWQVDYQAMLAAMSETVRKSPPRSDYVPRVVPLGRQNSLRLRSRRVEGGCADSSSGGGDREESSGDEEDQAGHPTPTRPPRRSARLAKSSSGQDGGGTSGQHGGSTQRGRDLDHLRTLSGAPFWPHLNPHNCED